MLMDAFVEIGKEVTQQYLKLVLKSHSSLAMQILICEYDLKGQFMLLAQRNQAGTMTKQFVTKLSFFLCLLPVISHCEI